MKARKRTPVTTTRPQNSAYPPVPRPGSILTAPGRELTFLRSSTDRLRFREDIGPDAAPVPVHRHLWQTERFTVLSGKLTLTVAGKTLELAEGESLEVPPRTPHTYAPSASGGDTAGVLIEVELSPALRGDQFFETIFGLTREGGLPPRRLRDVVVLMALSHAHGFVIGGPPVFLMRAAGACLAGLAGVLRIDYWSPRFAARMPSSAAPPILYLPADLGSMR
jgi:mannose-6-phosphate isomerase-like protein (cupin superfamily)